ncbi:O-antigen ligase family protein [Cardiobacteriaceae bacterium TAE3-ERU3]|nr:O-antigen ligase family protein [Cardiobacteriaceae bacterium TAE3-ERU3]
MHIKTAHERLFQQASNLCVFLFFALSLIIKSGYSYGSGLLLLVALFGLPWWKKHIQLNRIHYWLLALLALNAIVGILYAWRMSADAGDYNRPIRYLACMLLLVYLSVYPPRRNWLWWGIAVGAIGAGLSALYYTYGGNPALTFPRASRYLNAIQFGNASALLGVLCLCGISYARHQRQSWLLIALPIGFFLGLTASLLSQSRGGWVALLIAAIIFVMQNRQHLRRQQWYWLILSSILGIAILGILGKNTIQSRLIKANNEITAYIEHGTENTSVGARLSMWRFAIHEGMNYPLFGPSKDEMEADKKAWVADGRGHAIEYYGHFHNEYLDLFAKQGLLGLGAFLALLLMPLTLFHRYLNGKVSLADRADDAIAKAGYYLIILHMGFGLTQVSIHAHNSGFMLFVIPLCIFLSCLMPVNSANNKYLSYKNHP